MLDSQGGHTSTHTREKTEYFLEKHLCTLEGYLIIYMNIWLVCGPLHTLSLEILIYSNQLMTAIVIKNSYKSLVF